MVDYSKIEFAIISIGDTSGGNDKDVLKGLEAIDDNNEELMKTWHLTNKYFHADVKIYSCELNEFFQNFLNFTKLEAVLFLFNSSEDDLNAVKGMNGFFQTEVPELRMLWNTNKATIQDELKDKIFSWCLDHQFEFIENDDDDEDEEEESDFKEKYGLDRIIEALSTHVWANHRLKDEINEEKQNVVLTNSNPPPLDDLGEKLLQDGESFDKMFGKLHAMKDQAEGLEGDERKDYAEKVAYAFMEALGIDDDESGDEQSSEDR